MESLLITLLFVINILTQVNLVLSRDPPDLHGEIRERCREECGNHLYSKDLWHGNFLCAFFEERNETYLGPPCLMECAGYKPDEDQAQCKYEYCNRGISFEFCRYPGCSISDNTTACEQVREGKLNYYHWSNCGDPSDQRIHAQVKRLENLYGPSRRDIKSCWEKCGGRKKWFKDLWDGLHVCGYPVSDPSYQEEEFNSKCYQKCMGAEIAEDQVQCACEACKNTTTHHAYEMQYHNGFCEKPGINASISISDCEEFVCTGKYKYYGRFCELANDEELQKAREEFGDLSKTCVEQIGGRHQWYLELWKGEHVCAYLGSEGRKPSMGPELYFKCEGIKIAEDQNQCMADFCRSDSLNFDGFCSNPGLNTFINKKDCDTLVLAGKVDYHGHFCKLMTQEELEQVEKEFGQT